MDEMDILAGLAASEPIGEDGLKRSSATLLCIVPKDGKSPGYSADQVRAETLTITQQGRGALSVMPGQPDSFPHLTSCYMSPLAPPRLPSFQPVLRAVDLHHAALDQ